MHTWFCIFVITSTDTAAELEAVQQKALAAGAYDAVICSHWAQGGAGAVALAEAVSRASTQKSDFQFLYELHVSFFKPKLGFMFIIMASVIL